MKIRAASGDLDLERFCSLQGISPLTPESAISKHPDLNLLVEDSGKLAARGSLWWSNTPRLQAKKTGFIGHYAASGAEAGKKILQEACSLLKEKGCAITIGPLDGSTWHSYRLISESNGSPPFFLEIFHPPEWPSHFTEAGFSPLARYFSSAAALQHDAQGNPAAREESRELQIRPFDIHHFEEELKKIYALSIQSFKENFLYFHIEEDEFLKLYLPLRDIMDPSLVVMAEEKGNLCAFLFAIPDLLEKKRGEEIQTVIVKSMAVHPRRRGTGLGNLLFAESLQRARKLGYSRTIHAYIHEENISGKIARTFGAEGFEIIRRYTLFAKELSPDEPR